MLRAYTILRLTGYAAGLIGMILFVLGRQGSDPRGVTTLAGAALLLVSFVAFIGSYVLYTLNQVMRRKR